MTEQLTEKFKDGRNILRKGIENIHHVGFGQFYAGESIDKLAEYEIADKEGRLVVLPCKVGDTVHVIENIHIEMYEVNKIELKHKVFRNITYYLEKPSRRGCLYKYYDNEFGDKWFLTREKAENTLKEMEGN